jgi:hypothetical protein
MEANHTGAPNGAAGDHTTAGEPDLPPDNIAAAMADRRRQARAMLNQVWPILQQNGLHIVALAVQYILVEVSLASDHPWACLSAIYMDAAAAIEALDGEHGKISGDPADVLVQEIMQGVARFYLSRRMNAEAAA